MSHFVNGAILLIVEDDANELHVIRDYLTRAGFAIRMASTGWDALKRLKDGPVDMVISELSLAEVDGCSLREKLLLNPETRDVPFFYIVPQGKTDILVSALRSGVDDCVTKPIDPVELVARVQAVIARRKAYEEMVRIDPLTRLLNRPTLMREIRDELSRVERYKRFGSLVLLDVDDFAKVNAESGPAMGDVLLTCLAGVVLNSVRSVDIAGRFRGEQFLMYLPETDEEGAKAFAVRMQDKLGTIADAVAGYRLTFSCGIVGAPKDGTDLEPLLNCLVNALVTAKARTPGSIVLWGVDIAEREFEKQGLSEI